jgi:hypothetical protein
VVGEVADDNLGTQRGERLGTLVECPDQRTRTANPRSSSAAAACRPVPP